MFQPEAKINTINLLYNLNYIKRIVGKASIMPVVKANAYGHGLVKVCKFLSKYEIEGFCVALLSEAKILIKNKINLKILHLGCFEYSFEPIMLNKNLRLTINCKEDILFLEKYGKKNDHIFNVHLKIETGMLRLGVESKDIKEIVNILLECKNINIEGVYSHLSSANETNQDYTNMQRNKFISLSKIIMESFKTIKYQHLANSSALLKNKKNHFNLVRPGLTIYGIDPTEDSHNLKPALILEAQVCLIKNVSKGDYIGYNRTYLSKNNFKAAIIQIGYADGIPISLSNNYFVDYNGEKLSIIGKVSMDLICIDIGKSKIKKGSKVIIFGSKNTRIDKLPENIMESPYTILTSISERVIRIYK